MDKKDFYPLCLDRNQNVRSVMNGKFSGVL